MHSQIGRKLTKFSCNIADKIGKISDQNCIVGFACPGRNVGMNLGKLKIVKKLHTRPPFAPLHQVMRNEVVLLSKPEEVGVGVTRGGAETEDGRSDPETYPTKHLIN
ncbi:hypothetical protein RUND412_007676 [Rhizina undulata]